MLTKLMLTELKRFVGIAGEVNASDVNALNSEYVYLKPYA